MDLGNIYCGSLCYSPASNHLALHSQTDEETDTSAANNYGSLQYCYFTSHNTYHLNRRYTSVHMVTVHATLHCLSLLHYCIKHCASKSHYTHHIQLKTYLTTHITRLHIIFHSLSPQQNITLHHLSSELALPRMHHEHYGSHKSPHCSIPTDRRIDIRSNYRLAGRLGGYSLIA